MGAAMPAVSKAQFRFFKAMAANPTEARAKGISRKVASEFSQAPGGTLKGLPEKRAEKKAKRRVFGSLAP